MRAPSISSRSCRCRAVALCAAALLLAIGACEGDTIVLPGDPPGSASQGDTIGGPDGVAGGPDAGGFPDAAGAADHSAAPPPDHAGGGSDAPAAPDIPRPPDRVEPPPTCRPNDDGVVSRDEVVILPGASAIYLANAAGTTVPVDAEGRPDPSSPGQRIWEFGAGPRDLVTPLAIEPFPDDAWYTPSFPGDVTYVTPLGPQTPDVLGVFRLLDDRLEMLGLASRGDGPGRTLLVYDAPVELYRFPLRPPDPDGTPRQSWSQTVTFRNAILQGVRQAGEETYRFTVDRIGTVVLSHFTFTSVLRIRLDLTQTFVFSRHGNTRHSVQLFYFTECVGEVARIVGPSIANTPPSTVTEAAEFRRLGM